MDTKRFISQAEFNTLITIHNLSYNDQELTTRLLQKTLKTSATHRHIRSLINKGYLVIAKIKGKKYYFLLSKKARELIDWWLKWHSQ